MKIATLCYEKLNNKNRIKLPLLVLEMREHACLLCLINIHEVFYDVIAAV